MFAYHNHPFSGANLGINKTFDKIANRFYWPSMRQDITDYVKSCSDCQSKKKELLPKAGLMMPIFSEYPFDKIGIDFLGRFNQSIRGNT